MIQNRGYSRPGDVVSEIELEEARRETVPAGVERDWDRSGSEAALESLRVAWSIWSDRHARFGFVGGEIARI